MNNPLRYLCALEMHYRKTIPVVLLSLFSAVLIAQELAPDFAGTSIRGDATLRLSDYRGKVVFIDFWASWCPPCLVSLPAYDKMYQELGNAEFEFIAINVDEDTDNGIFFLEDHPVSYPVLADPEGDIGIPYKLRSLPVSYLLDRQGKIVQSYRSFKPGDEIEIKQQILQLLAREP